MRLEPDKMDPNEVYKLMIGVIVPRPIAWAATVDLAGNPNLAPFSFFTGITFKPPTVCFSVIQKAEGAKDTLRNIEVVPELTLNTVTEEVAAQMNLTSGDYPYGANEFELAGLTPVPSDLVRPPRVGESPISMECRKSQIVYVGTSPGRAGLIICEILRFHVKDDCLLAGNKIDIQRLHAVGRMAGDFYSKTRDQFEMKRPVYKAG